MKLFENILKVDNRSSPSTKALLPDLLKRGLSNPNLTKETLLVLKALVQVLIKKGSDSNVQAELKGVELTNFVRAKENFDNALGVLNQSKGNAKSQVNEISSMLRANPIYLEAAYIANDVYLDKEGVLIGGWKRSSAHSDLPYRDLHTGLISGLYERKTCGQTEYIFATAGTNPICPEDWQNNLWQVCGDSPQYDQALAIARELAQRTEGLHQSLLFTGHSLGGGEATNNALATQHKAIVFNPAGLSIETAEKSGADISMADELIHNFITENDVLNWMQDIAGQMRVWNKLVPVSIGKRCYIQAPNKSPVGHLMADIIESLEKSEFINEP